MISREVAIAPAEKIPVGRTLGGAYSTLFRNLWPFAQIATFPLALGVLLPYGWTEFYSPFFDRMVELVGYQRALWLERLDLTWLVDRIVAWLVLVLFMSHWVQFLAAKEASGKPAIVLVFSRNDLRVLCYSSLLLTTTACAALVGMLSALLSMDFVVTEPLHLLMSANEFSVALFVLTPVAIDALIVGRSAPVFAAAAEGQPMALRQAWRLTRRQTLRLLLLWIVLFWLTYALASPLQSVVNNLYVTLIINYYEPGECAGSYYTPLAVQLVRLPSAMVHCAAMALGAYLFLRVYRGEVAARNTLLNRFD